MKDITFRKLYDFYILKPLWLLFVILAVFYLYHRDWFSGFCFFLVWFGVGGIGGQLYPEISARELTKGSFPSEGEVANVFKGLLSPRESLLIAKTSLKLSILIGFSSLIVLWHYNLRWYLIIILGVLIGYFASFLINIWWVCILFFGRRYIKHRIDNS